MLERILPALAWMKRYERANLRHDLLAGGVVAVMLVPQGMAYAMLAGVPPVFGLYASTLPLIVYVLFGSSRQLAVGPVAMMSLLVFTGVSALADPGSEQYLGLVIGLALLVGAIQLAMGLLRLGFLLNFLSHAVISGFTSAAAIIIFMSQLGHLLGIQSTSGHSASHLVLGFVKGVGGTNPVTLTIGLVSMAILFLFKWKAPRFPAPIVVVAGSILLVYFLGLDRYGVSIVGHVPKGLPGFSFPPLSVDSLQALFPLALTVVFVGVMESISVAEWIAAKEKYKIDSNQEFIGLGMANLTASLVSAFPVTGGFSRTAVNYQAGARSGLASVFSAAMILVTLTLLTSVFYHLPHTVLAAVVMVAVTGLIDIRGAKQLFIIKKADGWTLLLTFFSTLILGIEQGILSGIFFSLLVFIWRSSHPHAAELGYLEKERVFRNLLRFPESKTYGGVIIIRIDASLFFANMGFLETLLRKRLAERPEVQWVIMDLTGVNDMDAVAIRTLEELMETYGERHIQFLFAGMKGPVRDMVDRAGWGQRFGERTQYLSITHALQAIGVEEWRKL